ncbi:MAG: hypothetical protein A3D52_01955 [Candidatus Taylorbacteria bacterium RIFCSPHIGHO2_02_FULL_44_36]|uniref:Methionyl/Leucyl tRNA synthetase domain-containing protein n=1 Tax=Candidatus Taylorbacteria bacterium RIFCSPLOWO2_12_FULL_44_15c TaxID=1802333 RepID=A0A1G2P519_9BACT|nr:MAG: hypothetical protein A3D52_01955 [Candidatus Taylorbacteria bacterium RIFCSPHIGHO2_02_FULL_44_36]OHA37935.1 MAG: hypothetical protein A3I97_02730 [Candidatus Taylorbacteria bacterium RIFCSPLOWO2_02_FULL_44_35]OHA43353.1 MAG: hypothetical protein A3G03_03240 [Candidatus Taylorbacteria bacterium RIFCSPLOWO2_12_FULL_44_15c]
MQYRKLKDLLGLLPEVNFIRTTDLRHVKSAEEFWKLCKKRGYIYKKNYKIKYCVGCELEKTESEKAKKYRRATLGTFGNCRIAFAVLAGDR